MKDPNVLIIVCDTLRKDVLGLYGGPANTPSLDILARDSMVYRNCYAPSPWTIPSHASLFSGIYPKEHGVHEFVGSTSADLIQAVDSYEGFWLPEHFRSIGYKSLGFSGNYVVSPATGFGRGFDEMLFVDRMSSFPLSREYRKVADPSRSKMELLVKFAREGDFQKIFKYGQLWWQTHRFESIMNYPADKSTGTMLNLLANSSLSSKFFLFINMFEMHEPYRGERLREAYNDHYGVKPLSRARASFLKRQYIKQAEFLDDYVGRLISILKQKNQYDNTLIILTSDHGQAFKEHDYLYHGSFLFDEIISVPLIVKPPVGAKVKSGKKVQSLTGFAKVITALLQGDTELSFDMDFAIAESHANEWTLNEDYSNNGTSVEKLYQASRFSVIRDSWKLTVNGRDSIVEEFLKDGQKQDPGDNVNQYNDLLSLLASYVQDHRIRQKMPSEITIS